MKYADDLVLLAKEEAVLHRMTERLIAIRCYGMEMNVQTTMVMRISRKPQPKQIMIDQKQLENVEYFSHLASMTTNDTRCTWEIKSRIAMA